MREREHYQWLVEVKSHLRGALGLGKRERKEENWCKRVRHKRRDRMIVEIVRSDVI